MCVCFISFAPHQILTEVQPSHHGRCQAEEATSLQPKNPESRHYQLLLRTTLKAAASKPAAPAAKVAPAAPKAAPGANKRKGSGKGGKDGSTAKKPKK